MIEALIIAAFAFLNRARGSKLFEKTKSTQVARIVSLGGMAGIAAVYYQDWLTLPVAFVGLYLWAIFGWGRYFAACHGIVSTEKEFPPVDWIMSKLPPMNGYLWGIIAMGLRNMMIAPLGITLAFLRENPCPSAPLFAMLLSGLAYWGGAKISPQHPVRVAEFLIGGMIGALIVSLR